MHSLKLERANCAQRRIFSAFLVLVIMIIIAYFTKMGARAVPQFQSEREEIRVNRICLGPIYDPRLS